MVAIFECLLTDAQCMPFNDCSMAHQPGNCAVHVNVLALLIYHHPTGNSGFLAMNCAWTASAQSCHQGSGSLVLVMVTSGLTISGAAQPLF